MREQEVVPCGGSIWPDPWAWTRATRQTADLPLEESARLAGWSAEKGALHSMRKRARRRHEALARPSAAARATCAATLPASAPGLGQADRDKALRLRLVTFSP